MDYEKNIVIEIQLMTPVQKAVPHVMLACEWGKGFVSFENNICQYILSYKRRHILFSASQVPELTK